MSKKENLRGALFFSDQHPQITGYLVIAGVEYEIAGWHATKIRAEIKAAERGAVQIDIFDGGRDEAGGPSDSERHPDGVPEGGTDPA
jgi:hypothetical protein